MLFDMNGNRVNRNPHENDFREWHQALGDANLHATEQAINGFCDVYEEFRSNFMPGQSPEIAALFLALTNATGDEEQAAWFFGNIVRRVIDDRRDNWAFRLPDRMTLIR